MINSTLEPRRGETGLAAPAEDQGMDWAVDKKEHVILS